MFGDYPIVYKIDINNKQRMIRYTFLYPSGSRHTRFIYLEDHDL